MPSSWAFIYIIADFMSSVSFFALASKVAMRIDTLGILTTNIFLAALVYVATIFWIRIEQKPTKTVTLIATLCIVAEAIFRAYLLLTLINIRACIIFLRKPEWTSPKFHILQFISVENNEPYSRVATKIREKS